MGILGTKNVPQQREAFLIIGGLRTISLSLRTQKPFQFLLKLLSNVLYEHQTWSEESLFVVLDLLSVPSSKSFEAV
jgi:hypothetical protein